jgi:hypothetical protein
MKTLRFLFAAILIAGLNFVVSAQPNPAQKGSGEFEFAGYLPCIEDEYLFGPVTYFFTYREVEGKFTHHIRYYCDFTGYPSGKKYEVTQLNNDFDIWNKYLVGTHTMKLMIWLEGKKVGMITFVYTHTIDYSITPNEWISNMRLHEVKCF